MVATLVLVVVVATNASGTGSIAGDRSLFLGIADDENGYVGFAQTTTNTTDGRTDLSVVVTNQFPAETALTMVTVEVNGTTVVRPTTGTLAPGESAETRFVSVPCDSTISVEVEGTDVHTQFTRAVDCS